jgi:hypothetical protein
MQRLKHAYARGARIEYYDRFEDKWGFTDDPAWDTYYQYRVHPKDAHLEYGPVSSALRSTAITGQTHPGFHSATGTAVVMFPELSVAWWLLDGDARKMQFLFLAELLADEGL